jgi:uncharacterized RDD family membrane protein YckC
MPSKDVTQSREPDAAWQAAARPRRPRPQQTAGLGARALALLLDLLLLSGLGAPLLWLGQREFIARLDDLRPAALLVNWGLPALWFIGFWAWQGATPGKLVAGIRVIDARSGGRPGPAQAALRWLGWLLCLLSGGIGFAWAGLDPDQRRGWHDRLAGTRVVRRQRRDGRPDDEEQGSYIGRHWRGEQSLAQSFWLNHLLLSLPLGFALSGLMTWISLKGEALQAGSIAVLIGWPLALVFSAWAIVGTWRAANAYRRMEGSLLWATLARLSLAGATLQLLASALIGFAPQADEFWQLARGRDPIGQATLTLAADGRSVRLEGPIGMGDATRLQQLLAGAPQVREFELVSPGGRVFEAERMVGMVRAAGASTRAVGGCESACTLVFLAGAQRHLMPGARLGFHRASSGTSNPVFDEAANRELAATYRDMGLPDYFIERTLRTPPQGMWYPKDEELVAHALVAAPPRTLDIELPAGAEAAPLLQALRGHPVWHRLEQRFPGLLEEAAQRMQAVRAQAGAEDEVQTAALQALAPRLPALITGLPPELRRRYLALLQAQLRAAAVPAQCQALLAGELALRRQLPLELRARETAWLGEAAEAEPPRWLPRPPSGVELEVVRRTLGAQAPGAFGALWDGGAGRGGIGCEQAQRLITAAARLPVAQRELAERVLFQRPGA